MGRGDQVLVPGDDRAGGRQGIADVVDALEQDDVPRAGKRGRVGQETGLRAGAEQIRAGQDPVAADAFVNDGVHLPGRAGREPPGQVIRPAVVGADRGSVAVGDRIPERHDRGAGRGAGLDVDLGQEVPVLAGDREGSSGLAAGVVTGPRDVTNLLGVAVVGRRPGRPARVEADRQVGLRRDGHGHRVTDGGRARRDGDRGASGEGDPVIGAGEDERSARGQAQVDLAERDRPGAELIGQPDPRRLPAGAGPDDVPDRLVIEPGRGEVIRGGQLGRRGRHRGRGPRGGPFAGRAAAAAVGRGTSRGEREGTGQGHDYDYDYDRDHGGAGGRRPGDGGAAGAFRPFRHSGGSTVAAQPQPGASPVTQTPRWYTPRPGGPAKGSAAGRPRGGLVCGLAAG